MVALSMNTAEIIEHKLRSVALPPLVRSPVPPDADPTEELVIWGIRKYAYSLIAHIREVLKGILVLAEAGNTSTFIIVCRHVYEWNMQSSYANITFKSLLNDGDLRGAWDLYLTTCGGNAWIKRHGAKYAPEMRNDEIEDPKHLREYKDHYKKHRMKVYGSENVDDDYGYLCERSHPNGFCFQSYISLHPPEVRFVEPAPVRRLQETLDSCVTEWVINMTEILGLAREKEVSRQLTGILHDLAAYAKDLRIDEIDSSNQSEP